MATHRILPNTNKSYFLFGPRATGKSTWLKLQVRPDKIVNLLSSRDYLQYSAHPYLLRQIVEGNPQYRTVVIDEIQKLPGLLDEVHSILFDYEDKIQFILTGSSARKLKTKNVNLLAGRALVRYFHPFSAMELGEAFDLKKALQYGLLPRVWNLNNREDIIDYLYSYVDTYLKEEIQQEASVRNLPGYLSFLEHFALRNAQVMNIQNLSGEVGIARTTINGYLDILEQTLIGLRLNPIHLKAKVKEVSTPKFYFFDTGVCRTLAKTIDEPLSDHEVGSLFETYILHEIKCYSDYFQKRWEIFYWGTPSENEVDFILCKGAKRVGIEVKFSKSWKSDFNKGLIALMAAKKLTDAFGVYTGNESLKDHGIKVLPIDRFVKMLYAGKIL